MDEALMARYWCHMCSQRVNPIMEVEMKCPFCESGFVEEMDNRMDHETDLGSDRAVSLWVPILLSMLGDSNPGSRLPGRESASEEDEETQRGESDQEGDFEVIVARRRRRIRHLIHSLHSLGILSEQENSENERERERENDRERIILINPSNQAIILHGSSGQNQNENQSFTGSFGDYLMGPGLDLLLQHLSENDPNRYGTPPAKKEAIEAMPTVKINEDLQCSVCLEDFEIGSEAKEMPCKHKFHNGCILPWLELHSSCPVCRFQIAASDDEPKLETDGTRNDSNRMENNVGERDEGRDGNGIRTWLPIPWPFNGLFSFSGSTTATATSQVDGGNSLSPRSGSSQSSTALGGDDTTDEN